MGTSCVGSAFKNVIEGKIEKRIHVTGTLGRGRKLLLVDLKETGGYCTLREEALDRIVWGTGCGPVVRNVMNFQIP